ncbi:MAG TPA: ADP-ribosylglycohydrolase family protein [Chthoniobacteraceae bacterium]|jgi:ADP-ribosylglycohydrolase|nr:ADP-ribosylglycohydrolase family protein [Chthoniobacteraceae bacterium]
MSTLKESDRMAGALWGALVGDALGVPVEFMSREAIAKNPVDGMRGFGTHNQPAGTWSDDSSLLLATVDSLACCGKLDPADLGSRFVRWERDHFYTPHGQVFDIGIATSQALSRLARGTPPEEAGGDTESSNGNGSLMRILPIALWFRACPDGELAFLAQRASTLTHRHPRSQMACALYCLLVRELLTGTAPADALRTALHAFGRIFDGPPFLAERRHFHALERGNIEQTMESDIASSGYVMHTLIASIWCLLNSASFSETVLKAVNLGSDTDTTGTVAGGLAGALYGLPSIPVAWKKRLARHDDVAGLFAQFSAAQTRPPAISAP